jgi:hypothetical protein
VKKDKDIRSAPPTEEERAALRLKKEQEKLAKQQAKQAGNGLSPEELKKRDAEAAAVSPVVASTNASGQGSSKAPVS